MTIIFIYIVDICEFMNVKKEIIFFLRKLVIDMIKIFICFLPIFISIIFLNHFNLDGIYWFIIGMISIMLFNELAKYFFDL